MATEASPPRIAAKSKRRWWQYSLSTLLLLMLACAVGLALFVNPAVRQRRAVEYVERVGGTVGYRDEGDGESLSAPQWLRQGLGKDYFQSVDVVGLRFNEHVSDAGLIHLKGLTALVWLYLVSGRPKETSAGRLKGYQLD